MSSGNNVADLGATAAAILKSKFDRIDVAYKTVHNTPIETAILVPKTLTPEAGARAVPVLVHFHGGGLIVGENPEPWFLSDWVRDLAYTTPAIFISPSYRLVPESRAVDSVDDIGDFWAWLHAQLPAVIHSHWPHLTPDLEHIAAAGESAGGFLAVQSALLFNRTAKIRAVIAQYPGLHTDLTLEPGKVRPPVHDPTLKAVVDAHVKGQAGKIRTSTPFLAGPALFRAVWNSGWPTIFEVYGEDKEGKLTLGRALEKAEEVPPAMWVVQGADDWFVEAARAEDLVERVRRERPKAQVKYTARPGGHGFDGASTLEEEWVREGVEFIKGYWLGGK